MKLILNESVRYLARQVFDALRPREFHDDVGRWETAGDVVRAI